MTLLSSMGFFIESPAVKAVGNNSNLNMKWFPTLWEQYGDDSFQSRHAPVLPLCTSAQRKDLTDMDD